MSAWVANAVVALAVLLAGIALLLAVVGLLAARRLGSGKLAWVGAAFLVLAAQGTYLVWMAYDRRAAIAAGDETGVVAWTASSLVVVLALYLAVLRR